jgi:5-methyltetrahydropteroyltriglutamate--homocysteine methyltransferase
MSRPPFRADHVGSFLRPERLREARELCAAAGGLPAAELHAIEDACIREVVRAQEDVGLKGITDGEFRALSFTSIFSNASRASKPAMASLSPSSARTMGAEVGFKGRRPCMSAAK